MRTQCFLLLAACSLFAWQEPTIRVDVQQVLVPVVVTDPKGRHVSGLRASDFRVFEDGVAQDIASFSTEKAGTVDDIGALARPAQAGPRHTFVICIDALHASPTSAARLRKTVENLFETEKPGGAQYVLMSIGRQLQVLQPATSNPLEILVKVRSAAWQNAMGGMDASAMTAQLRDIRTRVEDLCKRCACGSGQRSCESEVEALKQMVDGEAARWAAPTKALIEQFQSVVQELAKLPTGRTLILVSDGFPLDPKREFYATVGTYLPDRPQFKLDQASAPDPGMQEALRIASERNVTIYTLDVRDVSTTAFAGGGTMEATTSGAVGQGPSVDMLGTNRATPQTRTAPIQSAPSRDSGLMTVEKSAEMEQIAHTTGGVYFHESGDLLRELRSALADGREYYVLAYTPKNAARDGKFRGIAVETKDKKLTIRAKAGYWAAGGSQ